MKQAHGLSLSHWILLALVLMALGVPQRASAQAMNEGFDDALISERVKAAINRDATLRSMDIGIIVQDKVVQLRGFAKSLAGIARA